MTVLLTELVNGIQTSPTVRPRASHLAIFPKQLPRSLTQRSGVHFADPPQRPLQTSLALLRALTLPLKHQSAAASQRTLAFPYRYQHRHRGFHRPFTVLSFSTSASNVQMWREQSTFPTHLPDDDLPQTSRAPPTPAYRRQRSLLRTDRLGLPLQDLSLSEPIGTSSAHYASACALFHGGKAEHFNKPPHLILRLNNHGLGRNTPYADRQMPASSSRCRQSFMARNLRPHGSTVPRLGVLTPFTPSFFSLRLQRVAAARLKPAIRLAEDIPS